MANRTRPARNLLAAAAALAACVTGALAGTPKFADETATAGIDHTFAGGWEFMVGGGAASFDCNGDHKPELVLAGGTSKAKLLLNKSAVGGPLKFEPFDSGLELESVSGAYPLDIDSDGIMDVVLLRVGENVVMRGKGECRFERANEAWGFDGGNAWSSAFAATFEKGASWPTIAIGNYIDRTQEAFPWGSCTDNWLHRPGEAGRFAPPVALKPSFCSLSMLFTDWNRSGAPSLRVSNDREYYKGGQEQMWHVEAGQPPKLFGPDEGWKPLKIWGMGIASNDLNGDGYPEYFLTSMADNKLQTLTKPAPGAQPVYADVAYARGVTAHRPYMGTDLKPSTAWHAQFEDIDNDGLADLFVAKGNVWEMPDFAGKDPNNLLMQQPDGKFVEAGETSGVGSTKQSRGAALADFNLDGLVDLLVVNRNDKTEIWRNVTADAGNWVQFSVRQPAPNIDAINGWVEVRYGDKVERREITDGGGHAGGSLGWVHFGLGGADAADVRVIWPSGVTDDWQPVAKNGFYVIEPGKKPEAFIPPT